MQNRPRVGEILVAAGIIDEMQLEAALGEQKRWGRRLGVTLIKMGMVEEGHLIRALGKQLDLPVASLAGKRIPKEVIALVPARMASEHGVIPLFTKRGGRNGQLYLGMEDPSNLAVLDDLAFRTGMEIHPVMVGPTELGEAFDRYYQGHDGGASQRNVFKKGDTLNPGSLRVVTDDSPQPGTEPAEPSIKAEIRAAATPRPTLAAPPSLEWNEAVETPVVAPPERPAAAMPEGLTDDVARLSDDVARLADELAALRATLEEVKESVEPLPSVTETVTRAGDSAARAGEAAMRAGEVATYAGEVATTAREESERTRIVAEALTTLLVERGVLGLDALQAQILLLEAAAGVDDEKDFEPLDG
ncbi:MAG: hypothetical protein ACPGVZ_00130 [Myxococcota bacterium]